MAKNKDQAQGTIASGINSEGGFEPDFAAKMAELRKELSNPEIGSTDRQQLQRQLEELESSYRQKKMNAFFSLC